MVLKLDETIAEIRPILHHESAELHGWMPYTFFAVVSDVTRAAENLSCFVYLRGQVFSCMLNAA